MKSDWNERFLAPDDEVTANPSRAGSQTTLIQRVLERRSERRAATEEGTTATVAVMVRVLPPPKALIVITDPSVGKDLVRRIEPVLLDVDCLSDIHAAQRRLQADCPAIILTDSLELVQKVRAHKAARAPFIVYLSERDEAAAREGGLAAGADDCVGRRASPRELEARMTTARRVAELEGALRITLDENRKLSATDDLTRVASRRFFGKHFPREVERAARYQRGLSLILCDIDHFKKINDSLGHAGGDDVLKQFGVRLQRLLRTNVDWVARIGGEEFAIVLPEIGLDGAREVSLKLRAVVSHAPFAAQGRMLRTTASFGVCGLDIVTREAESVPERMLKAADAALYRSKHDGRNRVTCVRGLPESR